MAGRRGTLSVSAAVPTTKDEEQLAEIGETSAESVNSAASNTSSSDSGSEKLKTVSDDGDNMSTSVGSASSNSAETSSSSGSEPGGIKPSEQELVQETGRIRDEKTELKLSLAEDKLTLLERRIAEIEKGFGRGNFFNCHPNNFTRRGFGMEGEACRDQGGSRKENECC